MTTRGVRPEGFSRKSLEEILSEIEVANINNFGPDVIQTSQSPLGQINGLFADFAAEYWEISEDVYQSLDVDSAEGKRLDIMGRIRGVLRSGRSDADFRVAITNTNRPNIHLEPVVSAIFEVPDVVYVAVFENATSFKDANGLDGHSLAFAVVGGDDGLIGHAIYDFTVSGIGLSGNTSVMINDGTFCRTIVFLRPTIVQAQVHIKLSSKPTGCACGAPSLEAIRNAISANLAYTSPCGLKNGQELTSTDVMRAVSDVEGAQVKGVDIRIYSPDGSESYFNEEYDTPFDWLIEINPTAVTVEYV